MCQAISSSKTTSCRNTRVSRLLILAGLTLLFQAIQNSQSMPSREFREFATSSEVDRPQYEERNRSDHVDVVARSDGRDLTKNKPTVDPDAIKYPGEWERKGTKFAAKPLPNCTDKTFCEGTETDYPQEHLSSLIRSSNSLQLFSAVDEIELGPRAGNDGGAILCRSEERIIYPKTAKDRNEKWLFILQDTNNGYKQGVKIENCDTGTTEGSCNIIEGSIFGYTTSCKQKYVFRILAAVSDNGTAVTGDFSMPSSCCCQIQRTGTANRLGGVTPVPKQSPVRQVKTEGNHQNPRS